jgi:hypothetical protein
MVFGAQDLGGLAHEAHAGHHQRLGRVVAAEAGHFQRIGHAAAGFLGQVLQVGIDVVVRHQHRIALFQQLANAVLERWRSSGVSAGAPWPRRARRSCHRRRVGSVRFGFSNSTVLIVCGVISAVLLGAPLAAALDARSVPSHGEV